MSRARWGVTVITLGLGVIVVGFGMVGDVTAIAGSLAVSQSSVQVGDTFTVSVTLSAVAAWNVHVTASGPVTGCTINQVDATADALDTNKTFSAECTANGEGTATVSLSGDITSVASGETIVLKDSRSVTIVAKPEPVAEPAPVVAKPTVVTPAATAPVVTQPVDNRSKNNNIKEILVNGQSATRVDDHYEITVSYAVDKANVVVTPEDAAASVEGVGEYDLKVGDNEIPVVVTAEIGTQNNVILKIVRRGYYNVLDLDLILDDENINDAEIIINGDEQVSVMELKKIQESGKTVRFSKYSGEGEERVLVESWTMNEVVDEDEVIVDEGVDTVQIVAWVLVAVFAMISVGEGVWLMRRWGRGGEK